MRNIISSTTHSGIFMALLLLLSLSSNSSSSSTTGLPQDFFRPQTKQGSKQHQQIQRKAATLGDVNVLLPGNTITFQNVATLTAADLQGLKVLWENWFNSFFDSGGSQNVRNMQATITIQKQNVGIDDKDITTNTLSFEQHMMYEALSGAEDPEDYLTLPYRNIVANGELGRKLRADLAPFKQVGSIEVPQLPDVESVDVILAGIQIVFKKVGKVDAPTGTEKLEDVLAGWFNSFYSIIDDGGRRRSLLRMAQSSNHIEVKRQLQREYARNMQASVLFQTQNDDLSADTNTITFAMHMKYDALEGASDSKFYLTLPFQDTNAKGELGRLLRANLTDFSAVGFPIEEPVLDQVKEVELVKVLLSGVKITFKNVGTLDAGDLQDLKKVTEDWFHSFYNPIGRRLSTLLSSGSNTGGQRQLQQRTHVLDMQTSITFQNQEVKTIQSPDVNGAAVNSNTLTFDQQLEYVELKGGFNATFLLKFPYEVADDEYRRLLQTGVPKFSAVFPIQIPELVGVQEGENFDVDRTVEIIFQNVETIMDPDVPLLEKVLEEWFNSYYDAGGDRRSLQLGPRAQEQVRNMQADIILKAQDVVSIANANKMTFLQKMKYLVLADAYDPDVYITLPYRNDIVNRELGAQLKANLAAFSRLELLIAVPVVSEWKGEEEFTATPTVPPAVTPPSEQPVVDPCPPSCPWLFLPGTVMCRPGFFSDPVTSCQPAFLAWLFALFGVGYGCCA